MKQLFIPFVTLFFFLAAVLNAQTDYRNSLENRIYDQVERKTAEIEGKILRYNNRIYTLKSNFALMGDAVTGAFLGIESERVSKEKAKKLGFDNPFGSYVSKVLGNTAAERAGIQAFDYVFGIDEFRTSREDNLSALLSQFEPGDEVMIHFFRKGKYRKVAVVLGERADAERIIGNKVEKAFFGIESSGKQSENLDGLRVNVVSNSTAEAMGLQDGDFIKSINGHPIIDWDDISIAINNLEPGEKIEVVYVREGKELKGEQAVKSYSETKSNQHRRKYQDWEVAEGDNAFLGVYAEHISQKKAQQLGFENPYGSYVTGILKNTAAEKSGIQVFDYIYGVEEYRVGEQQRLTDILHHYKPGGKAPVLLLRKGKKVSIEVAFGKRSDAEVAKKPGKCEGAFLGVKSRLSDDLNYGDGIPVSIVNNSTANALGLKDGAIIKSINGYKMIDWTDIGTAINSLKSGEIITLVYEQNGKTETGSMPIKSYGETKKIDPEDCDKKLNADVFVFEFNNEDEERYEERIDISNIEVIVENITRADANDLKNKGAELETGNKLNVERLNLSPNPNRGMFKLEFSLPTNGSTIIKVFNAAGRIIYDYDLGEFSGEFSDDVDISQNGTGSYFLQIRQENKVLTKKIILSNH